MSDAPPGRRPGRAALWLIIALTAAPVVTSYLMFYVWPPADTVNYGELLEPRALPDAPPFSALKGKWVLVSVDGGRCDAACEKKLLYMRQLRLTQGKNMDRIERLWLVSDDAPARGAPELEAEGTRVARAGAELLRAFSAPGSSSDHLYLVDPLGNLMMRFPRDPEPRLMIKDLARLLKASQVG